MGVGWEEGEYIQLAKRAGVGVVGIVQAKGGQSANKVRMKGQTGGRCRVIPAGNQLGSGFQLGFGVWVARRGRERIPTCCFCFAPQMPTMAVVG